MNIEEERAGEVGGFTLDGQLPDGRYREYASGGTFRGDRLLVAGDVITFKAAKVDGATEIIDTKTLQVAEKFVYFVSGAILTRMHGQQPAWLYQYAVKRAGQDIGSSTILSVNLGGAL